MRINVCLGSLFIQAPGERKTYLVFMYKDLEEGTSSQFIPRPGERKPNLVCIYKDLEK